MDRSSAHPAFHMPVRSAVWSAVLFAASGAFGEPADKESKKVFVGYLYGQPRGVNFTLYTHLCHAFVVADENGNIRASRNVPDRRLTSEAHDAGVSVLIALGGWGWDEQFAAIVGKPDAEERYVTAVMRMVDEDGYDGIDVDWEYPDTEEEVAGFERLAQRFRTLLDELAQSKGRKMYLTMAASASPSKLKWLRTDFVVANFDWLHIMTYDFAGDWTPYAGHHSPLFASSKQPARSRASTQLTMEYLLQERKVPANRLVVGIPLYGRGFVASAPYAEKQERGDIRLPRGNYSNLHRLLNQGNWTRQWDDETKNPWLSSPDGKIVIGYDDAESVAIKTQWAMEQGFRGVFFWQVAADRLPDGANPLQQAAREVMDRAAR
jgi:chitinase